MKNFIVYDLETEENYTIIIPGEDEETDGSEHVVIEKEPDVEDKESNEYYSAFVGLLIIVIIVFLCGRRR